jgi:hypothetical protein
MRIKKIVLGLLITTCFASGLMAGSITWGSSDLGTGYTAGWLVALYEDVSKDGWDATAIGIGGLTDSDDIYLGVTTVLTIGKGGSLWGDSFSAPSGSMAYSDRLFSVIFNATTIADATQYKITTMTAGAFAGGGNAWFELPSTDVDATYKTTTVGDWQAVPEPATAMLLALGGGLAWLVRLKQRLS